MSRISCKTPSLRESCSLLSPFAPFIPSQVALSHQLTLWLTLPLSAFCHFFFPSFGTWRRCLSARLSILQSHLDRFDSPHGLSPQMRSLAGISNRPHPQRAAQASPRSGRGDSSTSQWQVSEVHLCRMSWGRRRIQGVHPWCSSGSNGTLLCHICQSLWDLNHLLLQWALMKPDLLSWWFGIWSSHSLDSWLSMEAGPFLDQRWSNCSNPASSTNDSSQSSLVNRPVTRRKCTVARSAS